MSEKTKVEILVAPGCASHQPTKELVEKEIAASGVQATVQERMIENSTQALQNKFLGSPTVRVNGIDVEPAAREQTEYGLG